MTFKERIRTLWRHHQVRYLVVAGFTSLGYLGLVAVGYKLLGWHYMVAIGVAQVITILCAFPAYRSLVFESTGRLGGDFLRFLSVWASGAIAGVVGTPFLVEVFGLDPLLSQVLAIIIVAVASYLGHRFFSFRHSQPDESSSTKVDLVSDAHQKS